MSLNRFDYVYILSIFIAVALFAIGIVIGYQVVDSSSVYRDVIAWLLGAVIGVILAVVGSTIYGGWIRAYQLKYKKTSESSASTFSSHPTASVQHTNKILKFPSQSSAERPFRLP